MGRRHPQLSALGLALLTAFVAGCERADSIEVETSFPPERSAALPANFDAIASGLSAGALDGVRHEGERLVQVFRRDGESVERVAYRERIATDGEGHYAIGFLEGVAGLEHDTGSFGLQHFQRQGLNYRYRDFAIRDRALFRRNYTLARHDEPLEVAGRTCTGYDVRHAGGRAYELAVDDETGLVLRYRELDAAGNVVETMEYERFSSEPDPDTVYHRSLVEERRLAWTGEIQRELERDGALRPRLAPRGYELREASTLADQDGGRWLKLEYTDGVECAFFLCALPDAAQAQASSRTGADEAVVFRMGTATVVQANLRGRELVAIGKVDERALLDLLESALP